MKMYLIQVIAFLLAAYLLVLGYFFFFQRSLIYFPSQSVLINQAYDTHTLRTVQLKTADNIALQALYQPATANQPTVIYLFGNGGILGQLTPTLIGLLQRGYGMLQVSYRGYSGNSDRPTEQGLYLDGDAAIHYLLAQGISLDKMIIYGESLGAAIAVHLATQYPLKALILQAPFTSLPDIAQYHYPFLPARWLLSDTYPSIDKIEQVKLPILIIHGRMDTTVPLKFGQRLYDAAHQPKQLIIIENKNHNDIDDESRDIDAFIKAQTTKPK